MRIYLAGTSAQWKAYFTPEDFRGAYLLESFFYCDAYTEKQVIPNCGDFLLDSGAYTFMQGKSTVPDFDEYAERYAAFINRNGVEKYFELDVDAVLGYGEVKRLREKLIRLTGKPCIPVWHHSRGKEEFIRHCQEFPYVAIGGLVGGKSEYARKYWQYFPWFIRTAHENGAKIHALGFTSLIGLAKFHFDSVDSTAWTAGNRFGHVFLFDGRTLRQTDVPPGHRIRSARECARHNYGEWVKFQRWADGHL